MTDAPMTPEPVTLKPHVEAYIRKVITAPTSGVDRGDAERRRDASAMLIVELDATRTKLAEAQHAAKLYYRADGTAVECASAEDVIRARKDAAVELESLRSALAAQREANELLENAIIRVAGPALGDAMPYEVLRAALAAARAAATTNEGGK